MIVTRDHRSLDSSVLDHFLNVHDQRWNMEDLCKLDVSWVGRFRMLFKTMFVDQFVFHC